MGECTFELDNSPHGFVDANQPITITGFFLFLEDC